MTACSARDGVCPIPEKAPLASISPFARLKISSLSSRLASRVNTFLGVHRAHVDDASATRPVHMGQARASGEERAVEMDSDQFFPVGVAELLDWMDDPNASVADQDIDSAIRRDDGRHAGVDGVFAGDVHRYATCFAASSLDLSGGRVRGTNIEVGDATFAPSRA